MEHYFSSPFVFVTAHKEIKTWFQNSRLSLERFLLARAHPSPKVVEAAADLVGVVVVVAAEVQAVEARLLAHRPAPELLAHLARRAQTIPPKSTVGPALRQ
jgi:hypothetical protein